MSVISMKQLLEAGVHFGHQTKKWNPKMKKYIFDARNDVHIINLEQTVEAIDEAYAFIRSVVASGKSILFERSDSRRSHSLRSILYVPKMARRYAYQFCDHSHQNRQTQQVKSNGSDRRIRFASQKRSY